MKIFIPSVLSSLTSQLIILVEINVLSNFAISLPRKTQVFLVIIGNANMIVALASNEFK